MMSPQVWNNWPNGRHCPEAGIINAVSSWFWRVFAKWAVFKIPKLSNWQISELLADQWTFIGKNGEVLPVLLREKLTKSSLGQPCSFFAHFSAKIIYCLYNTHLCRELFLFKILCLEMAKKNWSLIPRNKNWPSPNAKAIDRCVRHEFRVRGVSRQTIPTDWHRLPMRSVWSDGIVHYFSV